MIAVFCSTIEFTNCLLLLHDTRQYVSSLASCSAQRIYYSSVFLFCPIDVYETGKKRAKKYSAHLVIYVASRNRMEKNVVLMSQRLLLVILDVHLLISSMITESYLVNRSYDTDHLLAILLPLEDSFSRTLN